MDIRAVRIRISGGFAGLLRGAECSAAELTGAERRALEHALEHGENANVGASRDLLTYELDLDTDLGSRRLAFHELNAPAALSGLVQRLSKRARPIVP